MKNLGAKLVVGICLLLLAGCGEGEDEAAEQPLTLKAAERQAKQPPETDSQPLPVTLDGLSSAENVSFLLAQRLGYFAEAGLNVGVTDPLTPVNVVFYVARRGSVLAVSHQPQVVAAQEKGMPVVAVGSVVTEPTLALIWPSNSGIEEIADLRGKTIAITGLSFERDLLQAILGKAGLTLDDVEVKRVDNELVPALVKGRADAILGTWNVDGSQVEARGLDPVIKRVEELGVPGFEELVVITHPDQLSEDPQTVRAFLSALARGTEAAIENPRMAAEAIAVSQVEFAQGGYQPKPTVADVEATLPLLSRTGVMDPTGAARLSDWMYREGFVAKKWPPSAFMTNRYLSPSS